MNSQLNKSLSNLNKNGYAVIDNFFNDEQIDILEKNFDDFLNNPENNDIPFHVNTEFLKAKNLLLEKKDNSNFEKFSLVINNNFILNMAKQYLKKNYKPSKLMIYETIGKNNTEFKNDKKYAFVPHTDETYFLKFFLYITDVDETKGPLSVAPGTHTTFKKKRHDWIKDNRNYLNRNKVDQSYNDEMVPLLGKRGTLIVFDTDLLHKAGLVENGAFRKVIRYDFYSYSENYNTLLKKIFLKMPRPFRKMI